jgi:hypothetical protein
MNPSQEVQRITVPCADGTIFDAYFSSDEGHIFFMEGQMESLDDMVYIMAVPRQRVQ